MLEVKNTEVAFLGRAVKALHNAYSAGAIDTRWKKLDLVQESDFESVNSDQEIKNEMTSIVKSVQKLGSNLGDMPKQCHDHFLSGITVTADLKYPRFISPEFQRYHWFEIISSQSTMHTLTKVIGWDTYREFFNEDTSLLSMDKLHEMVLEYNFLREKNKGEVNIENRNARSVEIESLFRQIKSNLPEGYELWLTFNTNYLQLNTMIHQRHDHALKEWHVFCDWVHSLPLFDYLTGVKNV